MTARPYLNNPDALRLPREAHPSDSLVYVATVADRENMEVLIGAQEADTLVSYAQPVQTGLALQRLYVEPRGIFSL
jgi:hypothetical protein